MRVLTSVVLNGRTVACGGPASFKYEAGAFSISWEMNNPDVALQFLSWLESQKEPLTTTPPATDAPPADAPAEAATDAPIDAVLEAPVA